MIFYPRLQICGIADHYDNWQDRKHLQHNSNHLREDTREGANCFPVYFRGIPDTLPKMSNVDDSKKKQEAFPELSGRTSAGERAIYGSVENPLKVKWDYAQAFDKELRIHCKRDFVHRARLRQVGMEDDIVSGLIYSFGFPLFKIIAANWARLIQKRTLDLDLLEWRPNIDIFTVQESKSRRVAIVRHQRDIAATLEVLRHLKQDERVARFRHELQSLKNENEGRDQVDTVELESIKAKYADDDNGYNKGRTDGLVSTEDEEDSWERLYYDFFELKASIDALEKRADKIGEGMLGMLSVQIQQAAQESERSSTLLNWIAGLASVSVIPFTIIKAIYATEFTTGKPSLAPSSFWYGWLVISGLVVCTIVLVRLALTIRPGRSDESDYEERDFTKESSERQKAQENDCREEFQRAEDSGGLATTLHGLVRRMGRRQVSRGSEDTV